jgi:hypothetical protein
MLIVVLYLCKFVHFCWVILEKYGNDALNHGVSIKYTIVHKGTKITLLHLTPAEIVQADRERAEIRNATKSENQQVAHSIFLT